VYSFTLTGGIFIFIILAGTNRLWQSVILSFCQFVPNTFIGLADLFLSTGIFPREFSLRELFPYLDMNVLQGTAL
jgi:hypothetical protein